MEIPTARMLKNNRFRVGISNVRPYQTYYVTTGLFDRLEINGRVTEILGTEVSPGDPNWRDYGNYKDKALDFKYQFLKEGMYMPALSIGINDPHGTRLYPSQFIIASKQIYPFDFTLGFGNGRFGKSPLPSQGEGFKIEMFDDTKGWFKDSQPFWGIQFALSEKYAFMMEYNPIRYEQQIGDPAQAKYFQEPAPSKFNFGFRWKPIKNAEFDVSYQRGEKIGFNLSMPFDIGEPMIPIYNKSYIEPPAYKTVLLENRILAALMFSGFGNIGIEVSGKSVTIDLQNGKYFYAPIALDVLVRAIAPVLPESIEDVMLIFKENDMPMFSVKLKREDMVEYAAERLSRRNLFYLSKISTDYTPVPENKKFTSRGIIYGYKPQFQLFLNDPSGFWKGKIGLSAWAGYKIWNGATLTMGASTYPFANISTVNEPLSIPVRTDVVDYMKNPVILDRALFEQIYRVPESNVFTRFTGGILEMMYTGIDWEAARPFYDGRILLGISGSAVKKRDPDNPVAFKKGDVKSLYTTAFLNTRFSFPKPDIALDVKYGRFLAGDVGTKFTISKFINGVNISAWYSVTDTSVFSDNVNRGYRDKGVAVTIPIRLFTGSDSRTVYGQGVSPWTRDVAQDIDHFTNLFNFIGRNLKIFIDKDRDVRY